MTSAEDRYRTLLDASSAIADQPTVKAVLQSLRGVLSSTCRLHGAFVYVLDDDGQSLHVFEFDRDPDAPPIKTGTKISRIGAVARVLDEQEPVFMPDVAQEMLKHPALAPFAAESVGRPTYAFPVSTSQQRYGLLVVTKDRGQEFLPEDVELLSSLASHVAVALECALARDRAELYQRQVMKERDRLQLLLEVNNHIVSKLEVDELFQAVAASMRKHFGNDVTTFWLTNKQSGCLERRFLDFPTGEGFLEKLALAVPTDLQSELWRLRTPRAYSAQFADLPAAIRDAAQAESLLSAVSVPLVGSDGPLGLFNMSSRRANAFSQEDCDLLSQIGTQISLALDNALVYGRLRASNDDLQDQRLYLEAEISSEFNFENIIGKSAAIQNVLKQVAIVAPTDSTVLLHGETGTGKELIARAIHRGSPRRERTFVKLNCAAIPSGLLESELFGHEKGAFTGALMQKKGRFEIADHGTLFLDEIGDISMELQPKLLRAVQEREFERLGSTRTIQVNVRLIAATHRDIAAMIRNNQFREDLFYRLNVFPIEIPPLRERPGDIPLLVHYFVSRLSRRMQKKIETIPKRAMEALVSASWPGNVRELENFIERAVILTQGSELNVPIAELKKSMRAPGSSAAVSTFQDAERQAIIDALKAASGKIAGAGGAAERLGLKRTTLQNKIRQLQIPRSDY
jgi:formate hydrogenlyase transcriptional activator